MLSLKVRTIKLNEILEGKEIYKLEKSNSHIFAKSCQNAPRYLTQSRQICFQVLLFFFWALRKNDNISGAPQDLKVWSA